MTDPMTSFSVTVLMYHALTADHGDFDDADPHYAVTRLGFRRHLAQIRAAGLRPSAVADIITSGVGAGKVALTFDDGHKSNAAAAEDILDCSGTADFFVNPTTVGQCNYLDWAALNDLAKRGLSIQSHGNTHRYLDGLSEREIQYELSVSKSEIEDRLGRPVTLFAPPGGRLTGQVAVIAERLGYRGICTSRVGIWQGRNSMWRIPRFAVLASTHDEQLRRWISQDRREVARLMLRHHVLGAAKRLLGNRGYERLRARVLRGRDERGSAT